MLGQGFLSILTSLVIYANNSCPAHPEPYVDVILNLEKPDLVLNLNESEISKIAAGINGTENPYKDFEDMQYIGSGMYVSIYNPGLTVFKTKFSYETAMTRFPGLCHQLSVIFKIEAPTDVYIANSMARGSCEYLATLRHEEKHVIAGRKLLRRYKEEIEKELNQALKEFIAANDNKLFPINTSNQMQKAFDEYMEQKTNEFANIISVNMITEQQKLDTHEEYTRVRKECTHLNKYKFLKKYNAEK